MKKADLTTRPHEFIQQSHTKGAGFTLIEIMIALVLGVFLIGGVLKIFLSSKQTYRMQENLSRMQENGRFAMEFISRDIRMADYRTCYSDPLVSTAIAGTNDSTATPPPNTGTDTVTLTWKANACGVAPVTVTTIYTIENNINVPPQPSLFRSINGTKNELIEGIEDMQILYGVTNGTLNYYVDAATVPDWSKVISVRISLLAVSLEDNLTSQRVPYTYNGTTRTPTDNKLRRVFTSTIVVRNRL